MQVEQGFAGNAEDEVEKQRVLIALQATNWLIYGARGAQGCNGPESLRGESLLRPSRVEV